MKHKTRIGVVGLGKIGSVILSSSTLSLNLVADSRHIFMKQGTHVFSRAEILRLIRWKQKTTTIGSNSHSPMLEDCETIEVESLSDEIRALKQITSSVDNQWAIIDATSMGSEDDYKLAEAMIGCKSYCTVNKSLWSDYNKCNIVYQNASRKGTLLGLNCTSGVWADEMEAIPLALVKRGSLEIEKRDNSSLNSFFALVKKGMSAKRAISAIEKRGHLEPGASDGLAGEIHDLTTKTKIVANICGVLTGIKPSSIPTETSLGVDFRNPKQVRDWHLAGRRRRLYPACLGIIRVDVEERSIEPMIECRNLQQGHPLARDYPWRCAFLLRVDEEYGQKKRHPGSNNPLTIVNSGLGGAKYTASKIVWETLRCLRICNSLEDKPKVALPILQELEMNRAKARIQSSK